MATKYGNVRPKDSDMERFMSLVQTDLIDDHWYLPKYAISVGGRGFRPRTAAWLLFRGPLALDERVIAICGPLKTGSGVFCCNPEHLRKKHIKYSNMGKKRHLRREL